MSSRETDTTQSDEQQSTGVDLAAIIDEETRERLNASNTRPLWETIQDMGTHDRTDLEPALWKWETLHELKNDIEDVPREVADKLPFERRALIPINPAHPARSSISSSLFLGLQSYPPGDETPPHRHPHTAFRLVTDGCEGMKAVAEGEAVDARTNDLVATPSWGWHGHRNEGDETAIWFSVLDLSLMLEGLHLTGEESWNEVYPDEEKDPIYRPAGYHNRRYGELLPSNEAPGDNTVPYRFAWEDCYERLHEAASEDDSYDRFDGVTLEYVNPATGQGPVSPTMSMRLQLLGDGEVTDTHQHNSVEAYYVMQGSGSTVVGDETLEWDHKDVFVVPPMAKHHHVGGEDDTVLYAVSDEPVLRTFHLYREYDGDDEPVDLPGVLAGHDESRALMDD
jgi:gentisate 1,2-dioxygenase